MAMAQSAGKRFLSKFGIYFVLLLTSVIVLFPFYMTVLTAFKQPADARNFILALPEKWNLSNFQQVLKRGGYWPALQNSTIVTIFATIGTLLLNTILSYFPGVVTSIRSSSTSRTTGSSSVSLSPSRWL